MPSIALPVSLRGQLLSGIRAPVTVFSPADLFSSGSQGIWLDPSDLSTMFSDRAGTTAVTAPGTVVGLRLDKSKGLVLGAELVTNGDFSGGTTGWTATSSTLAVVGGQLVATQTGGSYISANTTLSGLVVGATYKITATVSAVSGASNTQIWVGSSPGNAADLLRNNEGLGVPYTRSFAFVAGATSRLLQFVVNPTGSPATITIDNISVRELAGNHAVAPTDAARPIYGVEPKGGRRNLLTWSEDFRNTTQAGEARPWTVDNSGATNPVVTANFATAPDGTMTADRIQLNKTGGTYTRVQQVRTSALDTYTFSVWLRNNVAGTANVGIRVGVNAVNCAVTGDWQRFSVTIVTATLVDAQIILLDSIPGNDETADILAWGAQLELGSTATNYQRVTTAYDITESGVATCHYVQYDGSDDSMSTSAIDFTATDKMSVFAGVRKLSDALGGSLIGHSIDPSANNGSFEMFAPLLASAGSNDYSWRSRGTTPQTATFADAAPTTDVVTGLGDIAGDIATLRINGTQVAQSTADQGTGNYGNYPLYIGRRGGTARSFNGRDYGILVVGKAVTPTETTDTETWLAAKTAQVTL